MDERKFEELVEWVVREHVNRLPSWQKEPAQARVDFYMMAVYGIPMEEFVPGGLPDSIANTVYAEKVLPACIDAAATDKYSWDGLKMIAVMLFYAHEPLPDVLADWLGDMLTGKIQRPQSGSATQVRDIAISHAIRKLVKTHDLLPTRNISVSEFCCAAGGSGCDIVGKAFRLNYKNVERIWLGHRINLSH